MLDRLAGLRQDKTILDAICIQFRCDLQLSA
jgi:hypothetical protein